MQFFNHKITTNSLLYGARLVHVYVPETPVSAVSVWFCAGSRLDPIGKEGLAHFFEHLLMIKTRQFPDRIERLRFLESHGMYYNAFTTRESARYFMIQLSEQTKTAIELLCDGITNSLITSEDILREQDVIMNEQLEHQGNPDQRIWHIADNALWPQASLGRELLGTNATIRAITKEDLDLFSQKYYQASNATFVVVSNDDPDEIADCINSAKLLKGDRPLLKEGEYFSQPVSITKELSENEQSMICLQFRTVSREDESYIVLDFIRDYLANNWTSRFNQILRVKKSLTYWVYGISEEYSDTGYLRFTCNVKNEEVDHVIELMTKEIELLRSTLMPAGMVRDHQSALVSHLVRTHSSVDQLMDWYGGSATVAGKIVSLNEYIQRIQSITPERIKQVASKFLIKENMSIVVMGV